MSQTYGEKAVGLAFNPSGMSAVDECKAEFAAAIDRMNHLRGQSISGEVQRMTEYAIEAAQVAQMWAVKALTWKD